MPTVALLMLQLASAGALHCSADGSKDIPACKGVDAYHLPSETASADGAHALLLHSEAPSDCGAKSNQIIVCAKDADTYRLPKGANIPGVSVLPKAEWKLFGDTTMGVAGVQRGVGPGVSAPAAMVTIKVPF